jgi:uncharacterized ParB-like nuclease family protein
MSHWSDRAMGRATAISRFRQARRRATIERFLARLVGRSALVLCYEQVRDHLRPTASRSLGIQEIPLQSVVGSVERCSDYTQGFMPLKDSDQRRWASVMEAATAAVKLPPIKVYRVSTAHFVVDGHHRVSVARQRGATHIQARVVDVSTSPG